VIHVVIWAVDAAERDGMIASLLEDVPGVKVVGVVEDEQALVSLLGAGRADVVVAALGSHSVDDFFDKLTEEVTTVALVREPAEAVTVLRAGARAVLLHPTGSTELAAAIQAAAGGLSALPTNLLDDLLRRSDVDGRRSETGTMTPRELEVLALIAAGASNKLIARQLGISVHTAKFHVAGVLEKLGAHNRAEAVATGARLGLVAL